MASYFVRNRKTTWTVYEQTYDKNKSIQTKIQRTAYLNLGFDFLWDVDKAKEHCKLLNSQNKHKRKEQGVITAIAQRVIDIKTAQSIFLPMTEEFHKTLMKKSYGSPKHQAKIHSHWKTVQEIINSLKLEVSDYNDNSHEFYQLFIKRKYSLDYVSKLVRIINLYGAFVARKLRVPFDSISKPSNHLKNKILDTYHDSDGYIGESAVLTEGMLNDIQKNVNSCIDSAHYQWFMISVWFGLRPNEIDSLHNLSMWKVYAISTGARNAIAVYQPKLTSISREKRWKRIPIKYPGQKLALKYIKAGLFKRPNHRTLKRMRLIAPGITTYAGRKGFTTMMLGLGESIESISSWLGHQSIDITWRKYKDSDFVLFGKTDKETI